MVEETGKTALHDRAYRRTANVLEKRGVIDTERLGPTVSLAWPRIVTGFAIMSKHTVDVALVGWAVGAKAVAGLAFAFAYWGVAKYVGIGLAGGTVSLVSRSYGAEDDKRSRSVVLQSVWASVALSAPFVLVYVAFPEALVGLLGSDAEVIRQGAAYLAVVAPGLAFEFFNLVTSRTYAGVGDTTTPMIVRAGGAVLNIVISGVLVFGLGMGVVGVAIGTLVSVAAVTVFLTWGMFGKGYGVDSMSPSPVPIVLSRPLFDVSISRELLGVSAPLMARKVAEMAVAFPLLWIASSFGPVVVAGFEVGRRLRGLLSSFNWGLSTACSSLVGQSLGSGDAEGATEYGASIIRLSALVYLLSSLFVFALAGPIAGLFVSGPEEVTQAAVFVRVAAVSAVALGINGVTAGALLGAGDTKWPFVASIVGQYGIALPVAAFGLVTPLGIGGLYVAFVVGLAFPAVVNFWRFRNSDWTV